LQAALALKQTVDWEDLQRTGDFLRGLDLRDGELTCFNAFTIPLYIQLDLRPSTRYLYLDNALIIYRRHRDEIHKEVAASRQRYVVTDLVSSLGLTPEQAAAVGPDGPLALPPETPAAAKEFYPWSGPIVFRAGRYCVHRVVPPLDKMWPER
jgi:hypothetical protein